MDKRIKLLPMSREGFFDIMRGGTHNWECVTSLPADAQLLDIRYIPEQGHLLARLWSASWDLVGENETPEFLPAFKSLPPGD